ncbi:M48 family metallopeptidase [Hoeflea prorocentri]|uniref:M48 family metallopeptidase n=1 Tax=Hoeflea prorocentri TaxID=1922333 RepID=A0A9X3UKT0_9HYPH|nr:M48 family metallopeptidase [Hoeflea prorocentri]MCY6383118.1 M48 family metallopeptidase [Hoeflea prorocentri]MDA5400918.1 M48 family metallopeptidase [Hoeflea prorocentri]
MFGLKRRLKSAQERPERGRDIAVAGRRLPLKINENVRAKRMTLRIEPGGRALRMSVPVGLADTEIDNFLHRHHGWLTARLAKLPKSSTVTEGGSIDIRGVAHRIVRTGKPRGISQTGEIDGEPVLFVGGAPEHLGRRTADFLKKLARGELEEAVARHAEALGKTVAAVSMKDTKSRWGSCTAQGRLSFSWRIVMAPDHVIDYLAAHEVAHLEEMNHGPRFWSLCKRLCPRTDEAKSWLKRNGSALHSIDFKG